MKILAIAYNTFLEALRNKALYSVLFFALLIICVAALYGSVSLGSTRDVVRDFGLFSLSFFGSILTIIAGVTLLNRELKQKTIHNLLSKPVARWQFVVGKHLGLVATISVQISLLGLFVIGFLRLYQPQLEWRLAQGILLAILELNVVASLAIFFSSIVVTTTLTALFTLAAYIAGRSVSYLAYFVSQESEFGPVTAKFARFLDMVIPDLTLFDATINLAQGNWLTWQQMGFAATYSFCYSALVLVFACLIFQRREML